MRVGSDLQSNVTLRVQRTPVDEHQKYVCLLERSALHIPSPLPTGSSGAVHSILFSLNVFSLDLPTTASWGVRGKGKKTESSVSDFFTPSNRISTLECTVAYSFTLYLILSLNHYNVLSCFVGQTGYGSLFSTYTAFFGWAA